MALLIGDNFNYLGKKPNFERDSFNTLTEMKAYPETSLDDGHLSYCAEDGKRYEFKSSNDVDETTGKWREFETGGDDTYIVDYLNSSNGSINENQYNELKNAVSNGRRVVIKDADAYFDVSSSTASGNSIILLVITSFNFLVYQINGSSGSYTYSNMALQIPYTIDAGSAGQVLTATSAGDYEWQNPLASFPEGGTIGLVLKKTSSGVEWANDNNTTYTKVTTSADGLMSKEDKTKLDSIAENANNYTLPVATSDVLGGIKLGYVLNGTNYPVLLDSNNKAYINVNTLITEKVTSEEYNQLEEKDSNTIYYIVG